MYVLYSTGDAMRQRLFHFLICSCLLALAGLSAAQSSSAPHTIRIGISGPSTGSTAGNGEDGIRGARMAIDRLNQQEWRIGDVPVHFELVAKDDHADPRQGLQVARELVAANVSAVLGPFNSDVALEVGWIYNNARVPMLTIASSPAITTANLPYVFRLGPSDADLGRKQAQYAAHNLKIRRIAVVHDGSAYATGLTGEFQRAAKRDNMRVAPALSLSPEASQSNVQAALFAIRDAGAQAIFFAGYVPQAAQLLREMHRMKLALPLLTGDAECSSEMFRLAGEYLRYGVYCTQGGVWLTRVADGAVFSAAYQHRYGKNPDVYAVTFYDGVMLLAQAMKAAGSWQPEKYLSALAGIRYKGATARYEFDARRDLKGSAVTILQLKDGGLLPLASF